MGVNHKPRTGRTLLQRLSSWFRPMLTLHVGASVLHFSDPRDFSFAIASRTAVPASRVSELLLHTPAQLTLDIENLGKLQQRIDGALACCRERDSGVCIASIAHIGVQVFSKDHDWRAIFAALLVEPRRPGWCLETALASYQQYLDARIQVCEMLRTLKQRQQFEKQGAEQRPEALETSAFSVADAPADTALQRLPQGEAVRLRLASGMVIPIKLARHQFALAHERQWTLIADDGQRFALREGVNSIGRSDDNDVPLGAGFRNVSRRHLLVETIGSDALELTDVSSYGTYIPPAAIAS